MPTYLHPGVYVEEIPSGVKPIEAVGTSIAAFVGAVKKGPAGEPELIHSWDDYQNTFCPIASSNDDMGLAISAFYLNGGKDAYVARLVSTSFPAAASSLTVDGEGAGVGGVLVITATSVGTWGNEVYIRIVKPNVTDLNFTLEVGHLAQNEFVADETFSNVNMNVNSDNYILTQVNDTSQLVTISLANNVESNYQNGSLTGAAMGDGGAVFSAADDGIQDNMTLSINVDGLGVKRITLGTAASFSFTGGNAADGDSVADALELVVQALGPHDSYDSFNCEYTTERSFVLTSGTSSS